MSQDRLHSPPVFVQQTEVLAAKVQGSKRRRYSRMILTALSVIPWVGGVMSAASAADAEQEQGGINQLMRAWLEEHRQMLLALEGAIEDIIERLDHFGDEIEERITGEQFQRIVRKGFRIWDEAETEEKRRLIKRLITHAGATRLVSDDVVSLFQDWIKQYHETHFAVMREIYRNPGSTRWAIWRAIYGTSVREDSADADLFKLLIRDLSTGGVVRQERETTWNGDFVKKSRATKSVGSRTMKSAFDDQDPYVLTELGSQFVHYTMDDVSRPLGPGRPMSESA